jgi:hypothetical protein
MHTEHTQTSMPPVGFEPIISVLEREKTVRALDRAATAIGNTYTWMWKVKKKSLWDVEDPTLSRQSAHRWRRSCQPNALAALCSPDTSFSAFDTHLCYSPSKSQGIARLEGLGQLKFTNLIGSRNRDLPACSIVSISYAIACPYVWMECHKIYRRLKIGVASDRKWHLATIPNKVKR